MKITDNGQEIFVEDGKGHRIVITAHPEGLIVKNITPESTCVYRHRKDRNKFLFSDAEPKNCWEEYKLLIE